MQKGFGMVCTFLKAKEGTTAIEFSLLAIPFIFTALAIIELGLFFATSSVLEGAVQQTARLIKTGQLQQSTGDQLAEFETALCDAAGFLVDCDDLQFQVQKLADFKDDITPTIDEDGVMQPPTLFQLNQITAGCVGLLRVNYPFQFLLPFFGALWSNYPNNTRLVTSTVVFQTEPYNLVVTDPTCTV